MSDIVYSRPAGVAARLREVAGDTHRFLDKRVLLTGEPAVLETENGQECLLCSLRLLLRICRNIHVAVPPELIQVRDLCLLTSKQLEFGRPVEFVSGETEYASYDAILSIGSRTRSELPWTVI